MSKDAFSLIEYISRNQETCAHLLKKSPDKWFVTYFSCFKVQWLLLLLLLLSLLLLLLLLLSVVAFNDAAGHGKQMLSGAPKSKSALPAGYFSDKFSRILEGEAYSDQVKMRRQYRQKEAQKNIGKPFIPSSGEKKMYDICFQYCWLFYILTATMTVAITVGQSTSARNYFMESTIF